MHPSVEATLCDFIPQMRRKDWREDYNDFLHAYFVEDWGVEPGLFQDFWNQLGQTRCEECGCRLFPYYIAGDKTCTKCEVEDAIH